MLSSLDQGKRKNRFLSLEHVFFLFFFFTFYFSFLNSHLKSRQDLGLCFVIRKIFSTSCPLYSFVLLLSQIWDTAGQEAFRSITRYIRILFIPNYPPKKFGTMLATKVVLPSLDRQVTKQILKYFWGMDPSARLLLRNSVHM